jgi:hypothetical protein
MLVEVHLTPVHRAEIVAQFAAALDRIASSDREYGAREMELVTTALPEVHETAMFLPALRSYIVRLVSGPVCSDSPKGIRPSVDQFNKMIARLKLEGVQPISPEEAKAAKDEGTWEQASFLAVGAVEAGARSPALAEARQSQSARQPTLLDARGALHG